jgi:hypothetical protein
MRATTGALRCAMAAALLAVGVAGAPPDVLAQMSQEYEIKVAFLYNFVRFVEWPPGALPETSNTITVCVLGDAPPGNALASIDGKTVKGRRLTTRRIEPLKGIELCHVLFVSSSEQGRLPQVLQNLRGTSVLTVGEAERFIASGGIINFVVERNKVRFEINPVGAEQAGLKLSSQLLSVARVVKQ